MQDQFPPGAPTHRPDIAPTASRSTPGSVCPASVTQEVLPARPPVPAKQGTVSSAAAPPWRRLRRACSASGPSHSPVSTTSSHCAETTTPTVTLIHGRRLLLQRSRERRRSSSSLMLGTKTSVPAPAAAGRSQGCSLSSVPAARSGWLRACATPVRAASTVSELGIADVGRQPPGQVPCAELHAPRHR